jgi:phosphate transport system protein
MKAAIHRHFHDDLSALKVKLLTMSGEAQQALGTALEALLERDATKAAAVIAGDRAVDALELEIEEDDLERVGDHAVNIAQSAERLIQERLTPPEPELIEMARQARRMLSDALDAFVRGDANVGREICRRDDSVDAIHRSLFRIVLTHMMEDPHTIGAGMELILVSRNLERVADLATNIAEDVVFLVEGKTIKHHAEGY